MTGGRPENLKPVKTTEEAKARGKQGGIESGKSKRKKKLMSQIYAEILSEKAGTGKGLDLKGVVRQILKDGGSPAVSMLKEVREATEGNKIDISVYSEQVKEIRDIADDFRKSQNEK